MDEGVAQLRALYDGPLAGALDAVLRLQKALRRVPVLELQTLSVVLVGTPNVGKSSIVRAVSTGLPEVNDYPFTTRSVTIGHIVEQGLRLQVMDTPGLLDRSEEHRNEMERLTFASLAHLPTAVVFVLDPSGLSGEQHSSLEQQLAVRRALRARFPTRPWLDVVSKADLDISQETLARMPPGSLHVSVVNMHGMEGLHASLRALSEELRVALAKHR
jgi:nucleolar GTP-binding protein